MQDFLSSFMELWAVWAHCG